MPESDAEDDAPLAEALADGLSPEGGRYADYRVGDKERVVVFAGRIFRYADDPRRAEAIARGERWRAGASARLQGLRPALPARGQFHLVDRS
ncbi:hypothetical protein ABZ876_17625 [Streptomyces sp. NPDC046931]|uniref:hypothetical protein n=1 Tax=Streptomyces sp. NPDC046931 TaxID=3154806 RepID=UPI0033EC185F